MVLNIILPFPDFKRLYSPRKLKNKESGVATFMLLYKELDNSSSKRQTIKHSQV